MHRRSIHVHGLSHFNSSQMLVCYLSGFSIRFQKLSRAHGQVTYVLLTRSPLDLGKQAFLPLVRLACIRHAASVHPEPGSNSPFDLALRCLWHLSLQLFVCFEIDVLVCIFISCSVFKDHLHLSSAHLYYQILFASSNVFLKFLKKRKEDSFSPVKPNKIFSPSKFVFDTKNDSRYQFYCLLFLQKY